MRIVKWFMQLDFRQAIWLAPLVWAIHEAEEWDIHAFESEHFIDPGYFRLIDRPVLWIGLALVAFYGLLWTLLTAWPKNPRFAAFLTLPFFIILSFGNVLQHMFYTFHFRTYAPGVVSAVLLVAPVVIGLTAKAIRGRLIPWWYAALLYVAIVPNMVSTVRTPDQVPPFLQNGQRSAIRFARMVLGRPPSALVDTPSPAQER